jgi:hypothetical protein
MVELEIGVSGSEEISRSRALEEEAARAGKKLQRVLFHRRRMFGLTTSSAGFKKV